MKNASVYSAILRPIAGCIFFISIFVPIAASAQTRGNVEVIKDARIDTLAARRGSLKVTGASAASSGAVSSYGYRVQIYNGSSRKEAYNVQARFVNEHVGMRTYIRYDEPNYKIRAGDFRTRLEAEKLMQELRGSYTGLFIIRDKITPPKITTTTDD
jgi:hypothetical protein